jgi:hypothetical protein
MVFGGRFLERDASLTRALEVSAVPRVTDLAGTMLITVPQCEQATISQRMDATVLGWTVNPKVGFLQLEQCKGAIWTLIFADLRLLRRQPKSVA